MSDTTGGDSSNAADSITIEAQAIEHLASIIIAGDNTCNGVGTSLNLLFNRLYSQHKPWIGVMLKDIEDNVM